MRFLLDEKFPKAAVSFLESLGHECHDFRGTEQEGADDEAFVSEAQRLGAVILTTDRDFYHTLRHQLSDHSGVVAIALKQPNREAILKRLEWLFQHVREADLSGRAFQLRDQSWMARPPLTQEDSSGEP